MKEKPKQMDFISTPFFKWAEYAMKLAMSQVLSGLRILITRPIHQADALANELKSHGATPLIHPTIRIQATEGQIRERALEIVKQLETPHYDGLLLSSTNAVASLVDALNELGVPSDRLQQLDVFCVGPATQRFAATQGMTTSHLANDFTADGVVELVREYYGEALSSKCFLFPRAQNGRDNLIRGLEKLDATVNIAALYETVPISEGPTLPADLDWVTFTSPSSIDGFTQTYGTKGNFQIACIGPVTAQQLGRYGLTGKVVASEATVPHLVEAIVEYHLK